MTANGACAPCRSHARHSPATAAGPHSSLPAGNCIVTAFADGVPVIEKVVGASIVNRFPYVVALSFCREPLSARHYVRNTFLNAVEASGRVTVQFLMPGKPLQSVLTALATVPEDEPLRRFACAGLATRAAINSAIPVFEQAYLVYEGRVVKPGRDFAGEPINPKPFIDVGSHRVMLFEIETISLRQDIASGAAPLHWRSLPVWRNGPEPMPRDPALAPRRRENLGATQLREILPTRLCVSEREHGGVRS